MMKPSMLLIILIIVVGSGCAAPQRWSHPTGAGQAAFDVDAEACRRVASRPGLVIGQALPGGVVLGIPTVDVDERVRRACLQGKGWRAVQ